jgi:hypothetical protein
MPSEVVPPETKPRPKPKPKNRAKQKSAIEKLSDNDFEDTNDLKALRDFSNIPPTLLVYTADGQSISLENFYRGKSVFLVCGGPSLNDLDLTQLRRPGVITFGVNNVWSVFRPHLWCCVDRPGNFLDIGWKDPSILKFAPMGKIDAHLHVRKDNGEFRQSAYKLKDMPSVLYFRRNEKFEAPKFFTQGTVNWGCHGKCTDHLGIKGSRSVMLAATRLIHYLGFRKMFIIGADFKMTKSPSNQPVRNYAWEQWRHDSSVRGNTSTYEALNRRFTALLPYLQKGKMKVFNCTPGGNLTAFPRRKFQDAVDQVASECEKKVGTEGWYNQGDK